MYPIKQSTICPLVVYMFDSNGNSVTGLVDGDFTKRISKNGGAFDDWTVTITELEAGFYSLSLSATDTASTGILTCYLTASGAKQANFQWRVETRILDNLAFPTISGRSTDTNSQGHVGLDLDETSGTLEQGVDIVGGVTLAQAAAMAASAALTAYDPPTGAEISAALTAVDAQLKAQAASTALTAYDPPTHGEMIASLAALNDIAVSDILAETADGSLSVQDALQSIIAYVRGRILKSSTAFAYQSQTSSTLWTNVISATDRNIL